MRATAKWEGELRGGSVRELARRRPLRDLHRAEDGKQTYQGIVELAGRQHRRKCWSTTWPRSEQLETRLWLAVRTAPGRPGCCCRSCRRRPRRSPTPGTAPCHWAGRHRPRGTAVAAGAQDHPPPVSTRRTCACSTHAGRLPLLLLARAGDHDAAHARPRRGPLHHRRTRRRRTYCEFCNRITRSTRWTPSRSSPPRSSRLPRLRGTKASTRLSPHKDAKDAKENRNLDATVRVMAASASGLKRMLPSWGIYALTAPSPSRGGLGWGWVECNTTHPPPSLPLEGGGSVSRRSVLVFLGVLCVLGGERFPLETQRSARGFHDRARRQAASRQVVVARALLQDALHCRRSGGQRQGAAQRCARKAGQGAQAGRRTVHPRAGRGLHRTRCKRCPTGAGQPPKRRSSMRRPRTASASAQKRSSRAPRRSRQCSSAAARPSARGASSTACGSRTTEA